jgi:alanine racemase
VSAPDRARRCWAEIDRQALRHNLAAVRTQVGPGVEIMAVVKANAYGHSAKTVGQALADSVEMLGVANVTEAEELRCHVRDVSIFILGPALPDERARIVAARFVPTVSNLEEAYAYSTLAAGGDPLQVHIKLDTGMGRIGILETEAVAVVRQIQAVPGLTIAGLASHLPVADEDESFTRDQLARFYRTVEELRTLGLNHPLVHVENSAGIIGYPAQAGDLVRAGLMLYGSAPLPEFQSRLQAVMTWKTRITLVRDIPAGQGISYGRTFITPAPMRIATLAAGYADGYPRHLSNQGAEVLIRGRRCRVLGRVTMDQILVDVNGLPGVEPGEEVVLLGRQGEEEIFAAELARKAGTIPWEIFTGVGRRVERIPVN